MTRFSVWWNILICGTAFALCASAQGVISPADVEALRKLVTVRNKMILLPDLLREVGRQTGVTLSAERELASDKLTVFVREVPAADLLERVADIVMGEWRKTKSGYQLVQTAQARRWEEELLALERENRMQDARKTVEIYMQQSQRPYAELVQEARQKHKAMMAGRPSDMLVAPGGETIRIVGPVWLPSNLDYAELPYYLIGQLLRGFSQQQWQAFWRGEPFAASTLNIPGMLPLPENALQWDRESVQLRLPFGDDEVEREFRQSLLDRAERDPTLHIILVFALDEQAGTIRSAIYRLKAATVEPYRSIGGVVVNTIREPKHRLEEHPGFQWWNRWQTGEEEAGKSTALQAKLELAPGERLPASEYVPLLKPIRLYFTLADYLEWLARRVDLQIVADAYRFPWNRFNEVAFIEQGETILNWLKRVVRPAHGYGGGWWRVEGDWLLLKHSRFWEMRHSELPERLVMEMERKATRRQLLSLNDYAALAREMSAMHRRRLEMPDGYTVRFSLLPLFGHLPMLRFWASLNGAQQAAALRNGVLPFASLTPQQQRMFWRSAWEGVLFGMFDAEEWSASESADVAPPPAFAVSVSSVEKYRLEGMDTPGFIVDTLELAERTAEDMKRWQPERTLNIRPVQVLQCRYGFFLFPNLRYTARFDIVPPE
ncbi:MAG: hypothetical protein ACP5RN_03760 [Armatimonadota bacterium]